MRGPGRRPRDPGSGPRRPPGGPGRGIEVERETEMDAQERPRRLHADAPGVLRSSPRGRADEKAQRDLDSACQPRIMMGPFGRAAGEIEGEHLR